MLADYARLIAGGRVHVIEDDERGGRLLGLIVLVDEPDHLHVENVAVAPGAQGRGLGRALMAFAEGEARRRGHGEIRLYTHRKMVETPPFYAALGYEEIGRGVQDGYDRIFFRKRLPPPPAG
jgi:GNAT superfamily N-acetyltransferase